MGLSDLSRACPILAAGHNCDVLCRLDGCALWVDDLADCVFLAIEHELRPA